MPTFSELFEERFGFDHAMAVRIKEILGSHCTVEGLRQSVDGLTRREATDFFIDRLQMEPLDASSLAGKLVVVRTEMVSIFEKLAQSQDCNSMMGIIESISLTNFDVDLDNYLRPRRGGDSNAHVGSDRSSRSSQMSPSDRGPTHFSRINLDEVFMNQPESRLYLRRWNLPGFLDGALLDFANSDEGKLEEFVKVEAEKLGKIRNVFAEVKNVHDTVRNETSECQPIVQLFLMGFLKHAKEVFGVEKTAAAANGSTLDLQLQLNEAAVDGTRVMLGCRGSADLFILCGEDDTLISFGHDCNDENVETAVEIKPPFGSLYHSEHRAGIDQLTYEVEALALALASRPSVCKGFITDLFAISVHVRVMSEDGIAFHMVSNRVVDLNDYVKHLLFICCCPIPFSDIHEAARNSEVIEVLSDTSNSDQTAAPAKSMPQTDIQQPARDGKNPSDEKASSSARKVSLQFIEDECDEDVEKENVRYLLNVDARVRGMTKCLTKHSLRLVQETFQSSSIGARNNWHKKCVPLSPSHL